MTQNVDRETVVSRLLAADDILILCHKNPDGDTIGSGTALCLALQQLGKNAALLCSDPIPAMYDYMPITVFDGSFRPAFVVAVDVAGIQLFGERNNIQEYAEHVNLCIDHHGSNSGYAYETLVDAGAAASAELLTTLIPEMGAKITLGGQKAENVRGVDAIVVSTAIPFDNPEVLAAKDLGITKLHRSDINAALVNEYKGIAVAGAHGKTTTTSMLGVALTHAGVSPSVVVGGEVPDLGTNAELGASDYLVSEADESDGSFLKLHPHIAVVTNVEDDHMDHYGTMENIIKAFTQFIQNVDKETGYAVICFDNENLRNMAKNLDRKYITYAIDHEADYRAKNITHSGTGISFDVFHGEEELGHVDLNIPGRHNVLDAMACIVTGLSIGVSFEKMAAGLAAFHGAKRRFQTKGRVNGVWIVDDYAHHPTEIEATLKAAKETNPKRLICAFQPHRYSRSSCTRSSARPLSRLTSSCSRMSTQRARRQSRASAARQLSMKSSASQASMSSTSRRARSSPPISRISCSRATLSSRWALATSTRRAKSSSRCCRQSETCAAHTAGKRYDKRVKEKFSS